MIFAESLPLAKSFVAAAQVPLSTVRPSHSIRGRLLEHLALCRSGCRTPSAATRATAPNRPLPCPRRLGQRLAYPRTTRRRRAGYLPARTGRLAVYSRPDSAHHLRFYPPTPETPPSPAATANATRRPSTTASTPARRAKPTRCSAPPQPRLCLRGLISSEWHADPVLSPLLHRRILPAAHAGPRPASQPPSPLRQTSLCTGSARCACRRAAGCWSWVTRRSRPSRSVSLASRRGFDWITPANPERVLAGPRPRRRLDDVSKDWTAETMTRIELCPGLSDWWETAAGEGEGMARSIGASLIGALGDPQRAQRRHGASGLLDKQRTTNGSGSRGAEDAADEAGPLGCQASGGGVLARWGRSSCSSRR